MPRPGRRFEQGIDPGAEAVTERAEERKAPTVAALADEYLEKWAKPRKTILAGRRPYLAKGHPPGVGPTQGQGDHPAGCYRSAG